MVKNVKFVQNENMANKSDIPSVRYKKDTLGQRIKRKLIMWLVIACIGGIAFVVVDDSLRSHLLPVKNSSVNDLQNNAELEKRLVALEAKVKSLQDAVQNEKKSKGISEEKVDNKISQLKQEIGIAFAELGKQRTMENDEQPVVQSAQVVSENELSQEALLTVGAVIVRDLAEKGLSFAYEAEVLQILAQGNSIASEYIKSIQQYAVSGVKGEGVLISSFNKFYPSLSSSQNIDKEPQESEIKETKNWDENFLAWLKNLFVRKKKAPIIVFNPEEDRVYELVNTGHLAEALEVMKTDIKYSKVDNSVLSEWKVQAKNYLNFEAAINGLIMNSMAHLHLKEMEH